MEKKFGTALNCIDGRTQIPIIHWMRNNFCIDYVDLITQPGMDKVLSNGSCDVIEQLKQNVMISITAHDSKVIVVVGHYDCAANPVSTCQHYQDIIASTNVVKSWGLPVRVIGVWINERGCVKPVTY
ncbi:MAG: carbonic anhydrase [Velocimicrobium sp.]